MVNENSSSVEGSGGHMDTWMRGCDIWLRARTNALAQEIASRSLKKMGDWVFIAQTVFVVVPIVLISLSLQITTVKLDFAPLKEPQGELQQPTAFPFTLDFRILSVIAIVSNGLALLLSFLANRFRWVERALKHDELLAVYGLIAQKARRLEDAWMNPAEAKQYCGYLQDLFESAKNRGLEPNSTFWKSQEGSRYLQHIPFWSVT